MQFVVRVTGAMTGDNVAQCVADALDIFNTTPEFLSNDRWEIEVVLSDGAELGSDGETASQWELLCDASDDTVTTALEDLERTKQGLLGSGACEVHVERLDDQP